MFTINTNSWHYNLMHKVGSIKCYNHPHTVCEYFRRLFFCLLYVAIIGAAALVVGGAICFSLYHTVLWVVTCFVLGTIHHPMHGSCVVALAVITVAVCWYLAILGARTFYRYQNWAEARAERNGNTRKEPKPNLLIEWIKNRHDKVCTRVEYK